MAFRLAFPNVPEAPEPGDESLLQRDVHAERNDGISPTKLRHHTVGVQDLHSQKEVVAAFLPDLVLREIIHDARLATGATGAFIGLIWDHEIVCQATSGSNAGKFVAYLNKDHRIVDSCLRKASLQHCPDSEASEELDTSVCRYLGARSIVLIPIMDETNERVGILGVFSFQAGAFSNAHIVALQNLTGRIANAMALADRGAPVSPVEATAPAPSNPRKLASIRGQLRFPRAPLAATVWRWSMWIFGIVGIVLASWMLGRAISQRAMQTQAKGPSPTASDAVYVSSAHPSNGQIDANPAKNYRFSGSVKPATEIQAAHEPKKKPNRSQRKLPDLEIENALDDASSESSVSTKGSDEPNTEAAAPGKAGAADKLSASAVLIPETVALDHLVERVKPDYPEDAKAQHSQGTIVLDVAVGRDGQVESVSPVEGNARLLASAAEAVGKWRFTPLIRNGRSVRFRSQITLHFDLP